MKAFQPVNEPDSPVSEWDSWSALYQPDGGSVNMQLTYTSMYDYIVAANVVIRDQNQIKSYNYRPSTVEQPALNSFTVENASQVTSVVNGYKVLLSLGVETPFFLDEIMGYPHMVQNPDEFLLQEYVASYFKVSPDYQTLYDQLPNYYNFLTSDNSADPEFSAYGFRYHSWDNLPSTSGSSFVKFGTMDCDRILTHEELKNRSYSEVPTTDHRVQSAIKYATTRMHGLLPDDAENKHFPCPIIFYPGRETILDYLHRKRTSVVVQSGGWIGKYFPLLGKTAIDMLFDVEGTKQIRKDENDAIGNFINRTRFPIKGYVQDLLASQVTAPALTHYDTVVVGAGCSGLFTSYRLNEAKRTS